jgi:hypothetical protein
VAAFEVITDNMLIVIGGAHLAEIGQKVKDGML